MTDCGLCAQSRDLSVGFPMHTCLLPGKRCIQELFTSRHDYWISLQYVPSSVRLSSSKPLPAGPCSFSALSFLFLAAPRQRGRAELFIVRLFEVKGFYILMSTK